MMAIGRGYPVDIHDSPRSTSRGCRGIPIPPLRLITLATKPHNPPPWIIHDIGLSWHPTISPLRSYDLTTNSIPQSTLYSPKKTKNKISNINTLITISFFLLPLLFHSSHLTSHLIALLQNQKVHQTSHQKKKTTSVIKKFQIFNSRNPRTSTLPVPFFFHSSPPPPSFPSPPPSVRS